MKWLLTCRSATALVLQAQDRRLSWAERLALRLHLLICKPCPRFVAQTKLMNTAVQHWRNYTERAPENNNAPPEPGSR